MIALGYIGLESSAIISSGEVNIVCSQKELKKSMLKAFTTQKMGNWWGNCSVIGMHAEDGVGSRAGEEACPAKVAWELILSFCVYFSFQMLSLTS